MITFLKINAVPGENMLQSLLINVIDNNANDENERHGSGYYPLERDQRENTKHAFLPPPSRCWECEKE